MIFLSVDPGTMKCGLAIVNEQGIVIKKMVILSEYLIETIQTLTTEYALEGIALGNRTNSKKINEHLKQFKLPIVTVDENNSTIEGRYRYLKENTKGLFKLIPIGLRIPAEPYDDYVAVILAERFLKMNQPFK